MTASALRVCAVIPTYDNPRTIAAVVEGVRAVVDEVIVVDDGSAAAGRREVERLHASGLVHAVFRPHNGGKGAAVKDGLREAFARGFSHALQVDADGQHTLADAPRLLAAAREQPDALVLGAPIYDATAPRSRLIGRRITQFWTNLEVGRGIIDDPMCGFRVYPLAAATAVDVPANRMDFDIEIAVRMVWWGTKVVNVPTAVRYVSADDGGVSHFRMWGDNLRISWMHTRLVQRKVFGRLFGPLLRLLGWSWNGRR
ncbi:MAG: glycosyltransferase family 2 protein [Nannocystaceae bacterium]|nr:glycosyltransferase family 2 protein [Nannocystaceae bacterium]